ncbi:MAG: hypothetical protein JNL83_28630 [Myxococcales bacterium]|nr:hypothetical protein [Myxococcales bacterium]
MRTLPLALVLATTAAACVDDAQPPAEPTTDDVVSAIEQENGGLDTTDEAPEFGVADLYAAAAIEGTAVEADPMASDPSIVELARPGAPNVVARDLVILWGRWPADPDATVGRDWSGSLQLSRGGMVVRRKIAFEQATDRVLPRTSRDLIEFTSQTRPHADGLVLTVFDGDAMNANPLTLTYTPTGGTAHSLDLSRLANGPIVVDVGDGNRILIAGHRRVDTCDHGFMRGRWRALAPNASAYLGVVTNSDGEPVGHIRGIAGQRQNGDKVMFGKFIDRDGHFKGILRGTYDNGHYQARWIDRSGDHGIAGGLYVPGPTMRAGGFLGRWAETSCAAN